MNITVFGTGTSGHQFVVQSLRNMLGRAGVKFLLKEVTDVKAFLKEGITSVPAVKINEEPIYYLKKYSPFNKGLRSVIHSSLSKVNFGSLPQIIVPFHFDDPSIQALMYAQRLATEWGAIVHVVYNVEGSFDIEEMKETQQKLDDFLEKIEMDHSGDILKSALMYEEIKHGNLYDNLLQMVGEKPVQFIVMPQNEYTKSFFTPGQKVKKLLTESIDVPIISVSPTTRFRNIKNILCFCNSLDCLQGLRDHILRFSATFNSKYYVLYRPSNKEDLDVETPENLFLHNSIHLIDARKYNSLDKLEGLLNENNIDFIMTEGNKESMEYYNQLDQEKFTDLIDHLPMMHI